jgi:hypothetical protein
MTEDLPDPSGPRVPGHGELDEVFAVADLYASDPTRGWGDSSSRPLREASIALVRPSAERLSTASLDERWRERALEFGRDYVLLLLPFELLLPPGRLLQRLSLTVQVDDTDARAIEVRPVGGVAEALAGGSMTAATRTGPGRSDLAVPASDGGTLVTETFGLLGPRFGWRVAHPVAGATVPPQLTTAAVIEVPRDTEHLLGNVVLTATVRRMTFGMPIDRPVQTRDAVPFAARVHGRAGRNARSGEPSRATPASAPADGGRALRLVVTADVKGYSAMTVDRQFQAQQDLDTVMTRALRATDLADLTDRQDQGDARILMFPPGVDEVAVLSRFYPVLRAALHEVNDSRPVGGRTRMRLGMDHGHTRRAAAGWDGGAVISAVRLRDCSQARHGLDTQEDVDFVLTVSDALYADVVAQVADVPGSDSFGRLEVDVAEKGFRATAWLHIPPVHGS